MSPAAKAGQDAAAFAHGKRDGYYELDEPGGLNPEIRTAYEEGRAAGTAQRIAERLEYLRGELRAERMSWGELHELQGLAEHIDPGDVELLEAAGVPEYPDA